MSSITSRPSTPMPNTHNPHKLYHGHTSSYFMYSPQPYTHHSQPLHFHLPSLPIHTPPSLLRRTSSTASSSSSTSRIRFELPPMPELVHPTPRRASTLSSSSAASEASAASPPMPTTPILASPTAAPPTPLSLPPPAYPKSTLLSPLTSTSASASAWNYDPFSTSTSDGIEIASYYPHSSPFTKPSRPTLKRRDTPRPKTTTLSSLGMTSIETDEEGERKMLRSVIDGGKWVIVG